MTDMDVELYPEDKIAAKEIFVHLSRKFGGMADTKENLIAFATEAESRFKEAGLQVEVDISNVELVGDQPVISPIINIIGRIAKEAHDYERHGAQVQAGLDDGVVGSLTEDGKLVEPGKLWTPGKK